jgi:hypothetical protein
MHMKKWQLVSDLKFTIQDSEAEELVRILL